MASGENLKVVALEPSSSEYLKVKAAFTQTVQKNILKVGGVFWFVFFFYQKSKLTVLNRKLEQLNILFFCVRLNACRMSICGKAMKCKRRSFLKRTDRKGEQEKGFYIMGRVRTAVSPSKKMDSTGVFLGNMVIIL